MEQNGIVQSAAHKKLKRDTDREALTRQEDAARTLADFEAVVKIWNDLDKNRRHRERDNEIGRPDEEMLHWTEGEDGEIRTELDKVVPPPLKHRWWRQLIRGDFLDTIFDCPYDLHELTSSHPVSELTKALRENQKEVLYYRAIRQWSPQRIAAMRGQSDRNIRKVYDTMIASLRKKLYVWLAPRYIQDLPLTFAQREFVKNHMEQYGDVKPGKGKKKAAIDGGGDE